MQARVLRELEREKKTKLERKRERERKRNREMEREALPSLASSCIRATKYSCIMYGRGSRSHEVIGAFLWLEILRVQFTGSNKRLSGVYVPPNANITEDTSAYTFIFTSMVFSFFFPSSYFKFHTRNSTLIPCVC